MTKTPAQTNGATVAKPPVVAFSGLPEQPVSPAPQRSLQAALAPTAPVTDLAQHRLPAGKKMRKGAVLDGRAEYTLIEIDQLHDDPDNPRKVYRFIPELAVNLEQVGMLQPIVARVDLMDRLIIMYGHRRIRGARMAGWSHVPVIIRYGVKDASILAQQLAENGMRDDMDPMDEARGLRRYMQENKIATYAQAGQKLGRSLTWVTSRAQLLNLDESDQELVSLRKLGITAAAKKARVATGNTRISKIQRSTAHFSASHPLASQARARCRSQGSGGFNGSEHGQILGSVACGECWEDVIRNDATRKFSLSSGLVRK